MSPANLSRRALLRAALGLGGIAAPAWAASSFSERMTEAYLSGLRRGARGLRQDAVPAQPEGELQDVRCVFHAHSGLSHDSRGTVEEIAEAARAAKVRAIFMTDHPQPNRRWWTEGLRGDRDGVLFVPGAELSSGLLVWRSDGTSWTPELSAGEVLRRVQGSDAVTFIAHPEQRKTDADWDLPPYVGMEIYNTHADAADSGYEKFLETFRKENPAKLLSLVNLVKKYQREAFAAVFDEQVDVLKRWDQLNEGFLSGTRRVVGIAGNDSHQNVGVSITSAPDGLQIKDALGKVIGSVPASKLPAFLLGVAGGNGTLLSHTFDPYRISFGYVSTHVLAKEVTEDALFDAVKRGRAYVAFDWMGDPSGLRYFADAGGQRVEMGGDVPLAATPRLTFRPNTPCDLRLLRNGVEVKREEAPELTFEVREPGVYRAEAWVQVGEEKRPWAYTNPIYVR